MNFTLVKHKIMMNDFRQYDDDFRLAKNGIRVPSGIQTRLTEGDYNQTGFDNILLKESKELLDNLLKAEGLSGEAIHAYDWTFRAPNSHRHPEFNVHVDHNESTMRQTVDKWLADKAETFEGKRIRIYNIWQPLGRALYSNPLALCDPLTIKTKDLVDVEIRYPGVTWSSVGMAHTKDQTWYHVPGMRPDERLVFLSYDTSESKVTFSYDAEYPAVLTGFRSLHCGFRTRASTTHAHSRAPRPVFRWRRACWLWVRIIYMDPRKQKRRWRWRWRTVIGTVNCLRPVTAK